MISLDSFDFDSFLSFETSNEISTSNSDYTSSFDGNCEGFTYANFLDLQPERKKRKKRKPRDDVNIGGKNYAKYNDDSLEVTQWRKKQYLQQTPKVVKTDIRYNYLTMFLNAKNSMDFDQISSLYSTFAIPTFVQYYMTNDVISKEGLKLTGPKLMKVTGVQNSVQRFYDFVQVLPDIIVKMLHGAVHTTSDTNCCKIIGYSRVHATKVFNLETDIVAAFNSIADRIVSRTDTEVLYCGTDNLPISTQINTVLDQSPLLPEPEPVTQYLRITLHCDENSFIERMDLESVKAEDIPTNW